MKTRIKLLLCAAFLGVAMSTIAQEDTVWQSIVIDSVLKQDANAVVRLAQLDITVNNQHSVLVKEKRVVTVFNKQGNRYADSYEWYDPSKKIKKIEATVYNALGLEIKKFKKKDFKDRSEYDGVTMMGDNRRLYFEHTPTTYPYTLAYECVTEIQSTAWIRPWIPIIAPYLSVEKAVYTLHNPAKIPLRFNEKRFEIYNVEVKKTDQEVTYILRDIPAKEREVYSPYFRDMTPTADIALQDFRLVDVDGSAVDWKSMGKWQYDHLVAGRGELAPETVEQITALVADAKTDKEKAKRIYEFVQQKTRYISIQLGIGGWMPMLAQDVDRLGYGDCKALTNYTKALLDSQGIESYYTIVYGDKHKRNIDPSFASMQGNHAILNLPDGEDDIWLECTSQTAPFGYIAGFTDDRNVLVVKPEGGEIKRTKQYTPEESSLTTEATIYLQPDRSIVAEVSTVAKGEQYRRRYHLQRHTRKKQELFYKDYWDYINDLKMLEITLEDDKDAIAFTERLKINGGAYASKAGSRLLFIPNVLNRYTHKLPKYEDRQAPLEIARGFADTDTYTIHLPTGYTVPSLPTPKELTTEFGKYRCELQKIGERQLQYTRTLVIEQATYPKEKYEEYRKFMSQVRKFDTSKIIINKES